MSQAPSENEIHPDEAEVPRNIRVTLEALLSQGVDSRELAPAIKNRRTGEIIDGMHRLEADPTWTIIEVDLDPVWERIIRLILNWNRRGMEQPEMTESLGFIAEQTGWTGNQIAEKTGIPKTTVYRYLPSEYKRDYPSRNHADATRFPNGNLSGLTEPSESDESLPRHEIIDVRVPGWLKKKFDELDQKRAEKGEAERADEEGPPEDEVLTHEELPEEGFTESGKVEIILDQEEEEPEPKTPEETLAEIYEETSVPPPTRFLQTALRHDHPDLTEEEIDKVIEETPRPSEPNPLKTIYGYSCPCCGTWKPQSSMKRLVTELEKRDPELAILVKERLSKQGWIG